MNSAFYKWVLIIVVGLELAACGTASNTGGAVVGGGSSSTPTPATITLTKSVAGNLSNSGSMIVTASVQDANGTAIVDGTTVSFSTDLVGTTITAQSTTVSGTASATFNANNVAGIATITATAGTVSASVTVTIDPSTTGTITTASISPPEVGVVGGGMAQSAIVTFDVLDAYGNAVSDGTAINFVLNPPLGGGETISATSGSTVAGQVQVTFTSGTRAGIAGVTATEPVSGVSTTATVSVLGGKGIASNFSLGTAQPSFEGYDRLNNTNDFTVVLGDIFGNAVKTGTPVTFQTEIGTIPSAVTNAAGVATTTYTTLGSDPGLRSTGPSGTGKVGYLTVLATAPGQEPFFDNNNNGIYDAGDTFDPAIHDFGEPFLDADEDGVYDIGEFYSDLDGNGAYSGPNGVHDANTTIWNSMVVVLSTISYTQGLTLFSANTATVNVLDQNGNPVDYATTYAAAGINGATVTAGKTGSNHIPFTFGYSLVTGNPTVPVYVPTFVNSQDVTMDTAFCSPAPCAPAILSVTTSSPSLQIIGSR